MDFCASCPSSLSADRISRVLLREWFTDNYDDECFWRNGGQFDTYFRLRECRRVHAEGNIFLPRSTTGRARLEFRTITDECDTRRSDCDVRDSIDVFVNGRTVGRSNNYHEPGREQVFTQFYTLRDSDYRGDRVRIRIELRSRNSNRFSHPRMQITYLSGGDPVQFTGPDGHQSRSCDIRTLIPNGPSET